MRENGTAGGRKGRRGGTGGMEVEGRREPSRLAVRGAAVTRLTGATVCKPLAWRPSHAVHLIQELITH